MKKADQVIVDSVINWFEKAVLGLNLCPFAAKPYKQGAIRFELSKASDDESCLIDLFLNLKKLDQQSDIETLVLIIPSHFKSFSDYNEFLALADNLLEMQGWRGIYQVASFHPDYMFAGSHEEDRANWTNRSPYPLLHLIREDSISKAVDFYPDIDDVPRRNAEVLRSLSKIEVEGIFGTEHEK